MKKGGKDSKFSTDFILEQIYLFLDKNRQIGDLAGARFRQVANLAIFFQKKIFFLKLPNLARNQIKKISWPNEKMSRLSFWLVDCGLGCKVRDVRSSDMPKFGCSKFDYFEFVPILIWLCYALFFGNFSSQIRQGTSSELQNFLKRHGSSSELIKTPGK